MLNGDATRQMDTGPRDDSEELLTPEFLRKLERMSLVVNRVFAGRMRGERRSTRRGSSVEFADFRTYTHGDDLRYVDWNVYARLEKLFLKLYLEDEDLQVHLLIDTSRSMGFGTPGKLLAAKRICAALGYIALCNFDRLSVTALTDRPGPRLTNIRGKTSAATLFRWLNGLRAEGATDFARALREYGLLARTPGLVVLISDLMAPGLEEGMRTLVGRKFSPTLLQVLSPEEMHPVVTGDVRLVDAETDEMREITVTSGLLTRYHRRFEAHQQWLTATSHRYGINFLRTVTAEPFEDLVLRYFRMRRVVE